MRNQQNSNSWYSLGETLYHAWRSRRLPQLAYVLSTVGKRWLVLLFSNLMVFSLVLFWVFSFFSQGSTVVVEVWDDDGSQIVGKLHDFVDKYTLTITRDADPDPKFDTQEIKTLCGKRSCMTVIVTLHCATSYLVPDCGMYCVSRNDSLGHYHCNYTAGRKECDEGWYDPSTDCVKKKKVCAPRNDSSGHYSCDPVSGEKFCLDGWTGDNCTQGNGSLKVAMQS